MHEYSIVQALLDRVEREAVARGSATVTRLWIRIGDLSGVEPGLLQNAYEMCRPQTRCATAPLEIARTPVRWECPTCGRVVDAGCRLACNACGAPARLVSGDEIMLDRIEMEVA
jgi:hydrogenase nickel incorporation protein HypA/HybF